MIAPPAPAYQCVTEMVPYTVMKARTRIEFQPVTETVVVREPVTNWVERQRVVCRPVFDTIMVPQHRVVCRPVFETTMVNQTVTVCRPVTSIQQIVETCLQSYTQYVTVPVGGKCGRCGHAQPACGCQTVAQTCYQPVPVVRNVEVTHMVPEVQNRQVPVTRCSMVREEKIEQVPFTKCRMVQEVVTERIPCTTFHCVPKTITRQIPYPVCETVPVTCYRPVTHMVPCGPAPAPAPLAYAAPQVAPTAQTGTASSGQH